MALSGTFTLDGTATGGAKVSVIDTGSDPSTVVGTTTTASDGTWSVDVSATTTTESILEYEDPDTGEVYRALNKPYVAHELAEPAFWSEALHRYNYDEGSGTTLTDSGSAATLSDATISGGTWTTSQSQYGGASVDYAAADSASAPNQSTMSGYDTGMTALMWVYYQSQPANMSNLIDVDGSWALRAYDTGFRLRLTSGGSGNNFDVYNNVAPSAGDWTRLGIRWSSGNAPELLRNGSVIAHDYTGGTIPSALDSSTSSLRLPSTDDVARYVDGPVMVWNRALTDQEVVDDYNAFVQ